MFNKNWWFLNFQKEFLIFSFCIRKLAVAFYMINEIQPKIKFQNIVQCPFKYLRNNFLYMLQSTNFRQGSDSQLAIKTKYLIREAVGQTDLKNSIYCNELFHAPLLRWNPFLHFADQMFLDDPFIKLYEPDVGGGTPICWWISTSCL